MTGQETTRGALPGPPIMRNREPTTSAELSAELQRLTRLFTAAEPAAVRSGSVPMDEGRVVLAGTTAPLVHSRFTALRSGLFVPAEAAAQPLDMVGTFLTVEEVFGVRLTPAVLIDHLQRLSFTDVLAFAGSVLAAYRRPGVPDGQTDRELAEQWLRGPALTRAANLLRTRGRRLIAPQAVYVLMKLAAFWCSDAVLPGVEAGRAAVAAFGAVQALDDRAEGPDPAERVVDTEVGELSSYLLANQQLNKPLDADHLLARFVRQWLQLPPERAADAQVVDLQRAYAEVVGAPLGDVLVVAMSLWAHGLSGSPGVPPDYFAALQWSQQRLTAALRPFTTDPVNLRAGLQADARGQGLPWGFDTIEQYPVVRLEDGSLLVLDPALLVRRLFGGLTVYDISAPLRDRGDRASRTRAAQVESCVRHLAEVYALELLQAITGHSPAAQRVFDDPVLQAAFARRGRRLADAAVDYGDAWVVVEVTTSKLTRGSVAASPAAISRDLDKLVGKVEQLDSTIAALRAEEAALTGAPPRVARRFYPLLVVAEGFPVNPHSVELLRQRARHRGLLTEADTAPLEVVDTVELSMLQAVAEQYGITMRDVLAGKAEARLFRTSVRDYLLRECGYQPRRPDRIAELMLTAHAMVLSAFPAAGAA